MADTTVPEREVDVLRRGVEMLVNRLPSGWQVGVEEQALVGPDSLPADAVVELTASDGSR